MNRPLAPDCYSYQGMDESFNWIHLSDLHLRESTRWESDEVVSKLITDLTAHHEESGFVPDALIFTGDCVFGTIDDESIESQFALFGNFLDEIRHCFSSPLGKEKVFIVPGNHDVDRGCVLKSATEWLRNPNRRGADITRELQRETLDAKNWLSRLNAYREFLQSYGLDHLNPDSFALNWGHVVEKAGKAIGLYGLNSAWSCATNKEKSELWMGARWQIGESLRRLDKPHLRIALVHHPSNWLTEEEDPIFGRELVGKFDLILHGHEHQEFITNSDGKYLISAGACYNCSDDPRAYSTGTLNLNSMTGEVRLRTWSDTGEGGWVGHNMAEKAPEGTYPLAFSAQNLDRETKSVPPPKKESAISLSGPPSEQTIQKKLHQILRRPFSFEIAHSRIRKAERTAIEDQLLENRIAWVVADWQMGKDGFLASALNNLGSTVALENVYRLDCGGLKETQQFLEDADSQLGTPFVEFAEVVSHVDQATLVFEDLPIRLLTDPTARADFVEKLKSILLFSPELRIIITIRQWLQTDIGLPVVRLTSLGIEDLKIYLQANPEAKELRKHPERFEDILTYTDGLPAAVDRLIAKSKILNLEDILEEDTIGPEIDPKEDLPASLISDVERGFRRRVRSRETHSSPT